jgi:hypothetical protein
MNSVELIGVYNADGGVVGELSYILGKTFQGKHCELCDITHSPFRRKKSWDEFVGGLAYPFELLHLNELSKELSVFVGEDAPMVILSQNGELSVLLSGTEMATCKGDVTKFAQLVGNRLTALSL